MVKFASPPDWSDVPVIWIVADKGYRLPLRIEYDRHLFTELEWPINKPTRIYADHDQPIDGRSCCLVSISSRAKERMLVTLSDHVTFTRRTRLQGICSFHWETPIIHEDGSVNYILEQRRTKLAPAAGEAGTEQPIT
jgi:hypothetical protein